MSKFVLKTESFEGPIDLLLSLIEKRKMHISDVSLASVADEFMSYIEGKEDLPLSESANFMVVASTLLLIKSISLLPTFEVTEEEQQSIEDLERRLKIYKKMREESRKFGEIFGKNIIFEKQPSKVKEGVFSPSEDAKIPNILEAVRGLIKALPKKEVLPQAMVRKVISLEEVITNLSDRVKKNLKMSFKEFSGMGKEDKVNVVISFLAMLELVKQGSIMVKQDSHFSDIDMETDHVSGVPKYN